MDFWLHQDKARRSTGLLVVLFALAVVGIIICTYAIVVASLVGFSTYAEMKTGADAAAGGGVIDTLLRWDLLGYVGLGVVAVVTGGSLYKVAQLAGGGHIIALHLGGRPLSADAADPVERRVMNVVEEMAIASGTPVPPVFMMDHERGINAFAAGYTPGDAVIGITRGCAEKLNRDQLQGVIAHEFSHILNGDMKLNIRLIGIIHGIILIGVIGYFIFRTALYSGAGRRSSKQSNPLPLLAMGLGLMAVGFIGTFFGNLIKAAVSRQREFLADASAVQFTRNPDGIAGALKVIGGFSAGSEIQNPNAPEASHMFFGQAITSGLNSIFATHPPLDQRIARIDRYWEVEKTTAGRAAVSGGPAVAGVAGFAGATDSQIPVADSALEMVGNTSPRHIAYAHELLETLPIAIREAAREPFGARALIYAMLIDKNPAERAKQLAQLESSADPAVLQETYRLLPLVGKQDARTRLPLIDMAIGTLRKLSEKQYEIFEKNVHALVEADDRIELFEWVLQRILLQHLAPQFRGKRAARVKYHRPKEVAEPCSVLICVLAYAGQAQADLAEGAFMSARRHLPDITLKPAEACGLKPLNQALDALTHCAPKLKRRILSAAAACITADHEITRIEAELFRAIADTLDCPVPPMLPGQALI